MPPELSRRGLLLGLAGCAGAKRARGPTDGFELVDLTHTLSPDSPYIHVRDATFPFRRTPIATIAERGVYANRWELTEHIGTHVDAPCHFAVGAPCLEDVPVADLFVEAVVLDVTDRALRDPDTEVGIGDLRAWTRVHGPLPERCVVLMRSGWDQRWAAPDTFGNADEAGTMHFPGFSGALIGELAHTSRVLGIGVDTFSIDPGRDAGFAGHRRWSRAEKWAIECLANLDRLPPRGAFVLAAAPKVGRASGGPARVVAWVPDARRF